MQNLVSPVSTGLQREEKYQNIPRHRWAKWRDKLNEDAGQKSRGQEAHVSDTCSPQPAKNQPKRRNFTVTPPNFSPIPDVQATLLFNAALLRER